MNSFLPIHKKPLIISSSNIFFSFGCKYKQLPGQSAPMHSIHMYKPVDLIVDSMITDYTNIKDQFDDHISKNSFPYTSSYLVKKFHFLCKICQKFLFVVNPYRRLEQPSLFKISAMFNLDVFLHKASS